MYTGASLGGRAAPPAGKAVNCMGIHPDHRRAPGQIGVPPSQQPLHDTRQPYVSHDVPVINQDDQAPSRWFNKSTDSLFREGTFPPLVMDKPPLVVIAQANDLRNLVAPEGRNSLNRLVDEHDVQNDFMQFPPYASSTRIAKHGTLNLKPVTEGSSLAKNNKQAPTYVRQPRRLNEDNKTVGAHLECDRIRTTHVPREPYNKSNQSLSSGRQLDLSDAHMRSSLVATADDRMVLNELIHRTPPCLSDCFEHVFTFVLAIVPLFQLHLIQDFILMKYLLPKVSGQLSRIILSVAAIQGTFVELCDQIKSEFFCDRSINQLTNTHFFQNFQLPNQSIAEYFDNMHAAYIFLQIPISQEQAVTVMLENLLPTHLSALTGKIWPVSFTQLPQLISLLTRQAVIGNQRNANAQNQTIRIDPPERQLTPHQGTSHLTQFSNNSTFQANSCFHCGDLSHFRNQCPQLGTRSSEWNSVRPHTQMHSNQSNLYLPQFIQQPTTKLARCFQCGDTSHFRNNCPQLQSSRTNLPLGATRRIGNNSTELRCYNCNKVGHMQRNCPQRASGSGND